jgi:hypothetical protein
MKTLLVCLSLCASSLPAADVTGTWVGTLEYEGGAAKSAYLILKQTGSELTGTAGPSEEKQTAIRNGKVDGNEVSFEMQASRLMKFTLRLVDGRLQGDVTEESNGGSKTFKLRVERKGD